MSFKEGVKKKGRLCFGENRKRKSEKTFFTFSKQKQSFGRRRGEPSEEPEFDCCSFCSS